MASDRSLRRSLLGSAVLCGWMLGVLVLPALHLAFHAVPHDHVGGGIHYHCHAGDSELVPHVHPHRHVDAAALRRASGAIVTAPVTGGSLIRSAEAGHDARGLAHFASAPGAGAASGTSLPQRTIFTPKRDDAQGRFAEFLLEGKRAPRPPPAA
jgi:hypothetical protein